MASSDAAALIPPFAGVERGLGRSLRDYLSMLRWHLAGIRLWIMLLSAVQVLAGVGFVLGISLFFRHIPTSAALFVSTGVPVINLLLVGLVFGPQVVAMQKNAGNYEYTRTLPVNRAVNAAAWATVCLAAGLPAMVISLVVAELRYGLDLQISPMIVPAVLLTSFAGTMIGYAIAHAIGNPMATQLISQLIVFVIFGFAPILYPISQMPGWLATLNWWFPFRQMAVMVRAALTPMPGSPVGTAYLVVGVWAVVSAGLAAWALGRRQ